jgi:hypothetical protein
MGAFVEGSRTAVYRCGSWEATALISPSTNACSSSQSLVTMTCWVEEGTDASAGASLPAIRRPRKMARSQPHDRRGGS